MRSGWSVLFPAALDVVLVRAQRSGWALPLQLATVGQVVRLGETIVFVRTLTGSAFPVRATAAGTVTRVMVRVGDFVQMRDPVVFIEIPGEAR